jgi:branched-chain amino acid transport system ATP-binding protein
MARTFQNFGLMEDLSVLDNVVAGLHSRNTCSLADELLFLARRNRAEREMREIALQGLEAAGLLHLRDVQVRGLPYGKRKAVELVRAMAVQPRLLLLDEPTAGLSDSDMRTLASSLVELQQRTKTTLVVISHHMEFLLGIADKVTVLSLGRLIATGTPQEIRHDAAVISAYLGSEV